MPSLTKEDYEQALSKAMGQPIMLTQDDYQRLLKGQKLSLASVNAAKARGASVEELGGDTTPNTEDAKKVAAQKAAAMGYKPAALGGGAPEELGGDYAPPTAAQKMADAQKAQAMGYAPAAMGGGYSAPVAGPEAPAGGLGGKMSTYAGPSGDADYVTPPPPPKGAPSPWMQDSPMSTKEAWGGPGGADKTVNNWLPYTAWDQASPNKRPGSDVEDELYAQAYSPKQEDVYAQALAAKMKKG